MPNNDRRLIEDLIPIREISAEASREKSLRHGNISTLHLWWARRPIVAARAAVGHVAGQGAARDVECGEGAGVEAVIVNCASGSQPAGPTCGMRTRVRSAKRGGTRAACTAGNSNAIKIPMMAITTSSSTRVKPELRLRMFNLPAPRSLASMIHPTLENGLELSADQSNFDRRNNVPGQHATDGPRESRRKQPQI